MAEKECDRVHTNIKQCQCINRKLHPTPSSILPPYMQCKTYATHPPPHPWCQVVWANVRTARIQQFFCGVRWLFGESVLCLSSFKSSHCIFSSHNLNLTFSKGSGITDLTDYNGICAFSAYYMYKIQFIIDCKYTHKPTDPIAQHVSPHVNRYAYTPTLNGLDCTCDDLHCMIWILDTAKLQWVGLEDR